MKLHQIVIKYLKTLKYQVKRRTYLYYLNLYEIYIKKHFNFDIKILTTDKLNLEFMELSNAYSNSLAKTLKSILNRALNFAYENQLTKRQFYITLKIPKRMEKQVECLTLQEQCKLEQYIIEKKKIYSYGVLISLYTGLRLGELLALKWANIDFKNKILKVTLSTSKAIENHKQVDIVDIPKTYFSIREIPLTNELIKILKELKSHNTEYVVCNRKGNKVDYRTYQSSFASLLKNLHIKHYGFHSLRHTFATRLLENKVDIKTISELLGHSSPTITLNRYVHTNLESKRKAVQKLTKNRLN